MAVVADKVFNEALSLPSDARTPGPRWIGTKGSSGIKLLQDYFTPFRKVKKKGSPTGQPPDVLGAWGGNRTRTASRTEGF